MRDHINVNDIIEEARFYKREQVINKNEDLLTDEILGKKKLYVKDHSPLDPKYIVSTKSKRMVIIGDIEGARPKQFVKPQVRKDTKRYLRTDDIEGASPHEKRTTIPEPLLPELHPLFQDKRSMPKELREVGNALKLKDRASNLMGDVLKRDDGSPFILDRSPNVGEIKSKYKEVHQRWL